VSDTVADVMGHSLQEVVRVLHMEAIDFYILVFFSISESCQNSHLLLVEKKNWLSCPGL